MTLLFPTFSAFLLPEVFLFFGLIFYLTSGLLVGRYPLEGVTHRRLAMAVLFSTLFLALRRFALEFNTFFSDLGVFMYPETLDDLGLGFHIVMVVLALIYLPATWQYLNRKGIYSFEYDFLVLVVVWSSLVLMNSLNFISIFLVIELQSLSLYVLAARERFKLASAEAGLKYFILGGWASALMLFGIALIYGFTGSVDMQDLARLSYISSGWSDVGIPLGLLFVLIGLLFKLGVAPFHFWTPDVYDGAPTPTTALLGSLTKIGVFIPIIRLIYIVFPQYIPFWYSFLIFCGVVSVIVGSVGALFQTKTKRLLAYSGIGHMGFILLGFGTGSEFGLFSSIVYIFIYSFLALVSFMFILGFWNKEGEAFLNISDLLSLRDRSSGASAIIAVTFFSIAGVPPLAGFFSKLFILVALVESQFYITSVIVVLASAVGAFYYLRLIKLMYFTPSPAAGWSPAFFSRSTALAIGFITALNLLFTLVFHPMLFYTFSVMKSWAFSYFF